VSVDGRRAAAFVGALALVPLLAACGGSSTGAAGSTKGSTIAAAGPVGGDGLVGPVWQLTSAAVDSVDLSRFGITLSFTDTDVSGWSGLNTYAGTVTSSPDGAMDLRPLATTGVAGPDDAMKAEMTYLAALDTVTGYAVTATELDLFMGRQETLIFTAA
jgi:heat shock protein HslJ